MSHFCLLSDPENYVPDGRSRFAGEASREYWLDHFASHFDETLHHAQQQYGRSVRKQIDAAREDFAGVIEQLRRDPSVLGHDPLGVLGLCRLREKSLRGHGLPDPFKHIKERENASAIELYESVVRQGRKLFGRDRWLQLIRGVFAGNLFDLGSAPTMHMAHEGTNFVAALEGVKPRPWFVDDYDLLAEHLGEHPPTRWSRAVVFVDNAGSDFILGVMPLARELALFGTQVVLAANEQPSLNDITADETIDVVERLAAQDADLAALIRADMFEVVSTGNDVPLIDLSDVSEELNAAAADADLVILEGMGRSVESNFDTEFTVDAIWLAVNKDEQVAANLGAELFDCVCKYVSIDR